jgi:hypothetical protein
LPEIVSPVQIGKQNTPFTEPATPTTVLPDTVPVTVLATYTPYEQALTVFALTWTVAALA